MSILSSVSVSAGSYTPPLTPLKFRASSKDSFGMWETDIDGHTDVIEEMRQTQRRINRWMELWQAMQKQIEEKIIITKHLQEAREEIKLLQARARQMERQHEDLKTEAVNQKKTLVTLQSTSQDQMLENVKLQKQLESKNDVIKQLINASDRAKRRNLILNNVKNKFLGMLKENHHPSIIQTKNMNQIVITIASCFTNQWALREVLRRHGTLNDLKNCRTVSKAWRQMSTPLLRNVSAQVDLGDNFILDDFVDVMKFSDESIPTGSYKLDETCLFIGNEERIENFFDIFGPTMQTLSVTLTENVLNNVKLNFNQRNYPDLKVLFVLITNDDFESYTTAATRSMSSYSSQTKYFSGKSSTFLPALVKAAPNIERFSLIIAPSMDNRRQDKYGRLLQETFQALGDKCRFLEIDSQFSNDNIRSLHSARRQLQELHVIMKESNLSPEVFTEFLQSQDMCLESLKIIYDEPIGRMHFELPRLSNLKCLTLKGFHGRDSVESIEYGKCFPKLKNFNLTCANDEQGNEWNGFFPTGIEPAKTVEEMMLTLTRFETVSYHRIGKIFPLLKKLRLVVPFTVPAVQESLWCALPNLEELELHLHVASPISIPMDELFTGIPTEICNRILEQRSFFDVSVDKIKKRSSITHLKALRRLKLNVKDHLITDVTGYLAFLPLKNLKYLEITYDSQLGLTQECKRVLRQRFQLVCRQR